MIAQIYGVGLITSRFTGLEFGIGVFVGLGGILVCSFLGGMKAVTWTQVAQYIILIVAYMIPVVWLSVMHTGNPIPQIAAYTTALPKVTALEKEFNDKETPKGAAEESVRAIFRERAAAADAKLKGLADGGPAFLASEKQKLVDKVRRGEGKRRRQGRRGCRKGGQGLPGRCRGGQGCMDQGQDWRRCPRRAGQGTRRAVPGQRQDAGGAGKVARHRQEELPGADLLPDGGYRRAAAHPDALLHHAFGQGGAPLGVLVAVLHLPALLHRAGPGHPGQVRRL